jgi:glycosyltransferase involved in cell wall biosynthesis
MTNPLISIIIASYNSEKTINKTLDSIYNQTYQNFELIIIDGKSTDGTIDLIMNYESIFCNKLIWISEKDNGIYEAWNKGISLSCGRWISFIGSDDYYEINALEKYVNIINDNQNINFISSKCLLVNSRYERIREYGLKWSNKMLTYCTIAHVGSFHKRDLFVTEPFFDTRYKITADYDFLLKHNDKIKPYFIPIITAVVLNTGISGQDIFFVAKERTLVKIRNNCKSIFLCYLDYIDIILKFYFRKYFL